jgi:hypothetical protein
MYLATEGKCSVPFQRVWSTIKAISKINIYDIKMIGTKIGVRKREKNGEGEDWAWNEKLKLKNHIHLCSIHKININQYHSFLQGEME